MTDTPKEIKKMEVYPETFVFPKEWSEEKKELAREMVRMKAESLNSLCVVYYTNCGCDTKIDFILDRFPMSTKIHSKCQKCRKHCLAEISDPIIFYLKMTDQEYSQKDLKDMVITESRQKHLIQLYRDMSY